MITFWRSWDNCCDDPDELVPTLMTLSHKLFDDPGNNWWTLRWPETTVWQTKYDYSWRLQLVFFITEVESCLSYWLIMKKMYAVQCSLSTFLLEGRCMWDCPRVGIKKILKMIPRNFPCFLLYLSNCLLLTCFHLFTYLGMHTLKSKSMRALDLLFNRWMKYTAIRTNSKLHSFAVKDLSLIIKSLPKEVRASGKQAKLKITLLPFRNLQFVFASVPKPPSTCHLLLMKNWKKCKNSLIVAYH